MPAITIVFGEMTPVDKMEEDEGRSCPRPTKDAALNAENKAAAVKSSKYRDPMDTGEANTREICGVCAAFNQTEDVLECIGDMSGDKGYCQLLKFCCSAEHTCNKWVKGGPITDDIEEDYGETM